MQNNLKNNNMKFLLSKNNHSKLNAKPIDSLTINKYFNSNNGFGEYKSIAISLLKQTIDILNEFDIDYFLISGTLLGLVRHNDFIPWDDDIDIIVDSKIMSKLFIIKNKYKDTFNFNFIEKYYLIKINFKKENVNNWPFIDIFSFSYDERKEKLIFFNKTWDIKYFFPKQNTLFLNINVSIPNDPHYFLKINYKEDYMNILVSNQYNHKLERIIGTKIKINKEELIV